MAAYLSGRELGARLQRALGLGHLAVTSIVVRVEADDAARAEARVRAAGGVTFEVRSLVDDAQGEALVREVTDFASHGWRRFGPSRATEVSEAYVPQGPAERLALAVLDGDWEAALGLADLVQESWAEAQRAKGPA